MAILRPPRLRLATAALMVIMISTINKFIINNYNERTTIMCTYARETDDEYYPGGGGGGSGSSGGGGDDGNYTTTNPSEACVGPPPPPYKLAVYEEDAALLEFAENIEHWEADFFLWGAFGYGLDKAAPELVLGGPPPIGVRKANLEDPLAHKIIAEFAYQEIGHLRVLKTNFGGIPRPLMNLSEANFAYFMDLAFGYKLNPSFDPYRDSLHYFLGSYITPYVGLTGYVGANTLLQGYFSQRVTAGLLGVEAGQDAVIRHYLLQRANEVVKPYNNYTVADFTDRISNLRNTLGMCGLKDEGVIVPVPVPLQQQDDLGPEPGLFTNVLSANRDSLSYSRTPAEILRIMYQTGDEHLPGGFYPQGANGNIATMYLN